MPQNKLPFLISFVSFSFEMRVTWTQRNWLLKSLSMGALSRSTCTLRNKKRQNKERRKKTPIQFHHSAEFTKPNNLHIAVNCIHCLFFLLFFLFSFLLFVFFPLGNYVHSRVSALSSELYRIIKSTYNRPICM